jgi:serine/threonine protein kinase
MSRTEIMGAPVVPEQAPQAFGKYRVIALLGSGGFGNVWRCHDEALGRDVAVKALTPGARQQPGLRERFLREAKALAQVSHPCVVQVFDVGEESGTPFFVMELIQGQDLERVVRTQGPLSEQDALLKGRAVATGLQAAYAAGVVHRDVKPANIMVGGSREHAVIKITDFGLAFPSGGEGGRLTSETTVLGTPDYVAPEQARGLPVDLRADMYALGATLFELLTGRVVFPRASPQATLAAHLSEPPEPLRSVNPALSVATNNLVMRLLSKDPAARFPSYGELHAGFDHALGTAPLKGPPMPPLAAPPAPRAEGDKTPLNSVSPADGSVVTENLVLCFLDLPDFHDRTRQQTRGENEEWTQRFSDGIKRLIRQRSGRFIKQGYGTVLCTFTSPTDAVHFAMHAVDAAWEWGRGKPELMSFPVRVGLSMGEVRVERGDVFGDPVNVAARVMGKANTHEVWFSDAVYLAMNRSEVPSENVGSHDLKGVPVAVRLFKALPRKGYVPLAGAAPFGVQAGMEMVEARHLLQAGARLLQHALGPALRITRGLVSLAWGSIPLRHRRRVAWGTPVLVGVMLGTWALIQKMDPYAVEKSLLEAGKAAAAAHALERRKMEHPKAHFLYAKALLQSGKKSEGLDELAGALSRDHALADPQALALVMDVFHIKDDSVEYLVTHHFGLKARDALREQLESERFHARHHAASALKELGLSDDVDPIALALKDIRTENECARRKAAVWSIEHVGGPRALEALAAARNNPGSDARCISEAVSAAEKRMKQKLVRTSP